MSTRKIHTQNLYSTPNTESKLFSSSLSMAITKKGNREQGTGNREQGTGNRKCPVLEFPKTLVLSKGNREQGTGNRERICCLFKNQIGVLSLFTVPRSLFPVPFFRKKMFFKESGTNAQCVSFAERLRRRREKKTASLFQSHVFKHEFFLFPVPCSLFPLNCQLVTSMNCGIFRARC